jgi:hypothetical protein
MGHTVPQAASFSDDSFPFLLFLRVTPVFNFDAIAFAAQTFGAAHSAAAATAFGADLEGTLGLRCLESPEARKRVESLLDFVQDTPPQFPGCPLLRLRAHDGAQSRDCLIEFSCICVAGVSFRLRRVVGAVPP